MVRNIVNAFNNHKKGNIIGILLKDQAVLILEQILKMKGIDLTADELSKTNDFVLLKECLSEKWEKETMKYSQGLSILSNPFIMRNKKLKKVCHQNKICNFYELLKRNKRSFSAILGHLIPRLCKIITENVKEIKIKSKYFCRANHCDFLNELLRDEGILIDMLKNIVKEKRDFAKYIIRIVLSGRKTVEMYAKSKPPKSQI